MPEPTCGGTGWAPDFIGPRGLPSHDMRACPGCAHPACPSMVDCRPAEVREPLCHDDDCQGESCSETHRLLPRPSSWDGKAELLRRLAAEAESWPQWKREMAGLPPVSQPPSPTETPAETDRRGAGDPVRDAVELGELLRGASAVGHELGRELGRKEGDAAGYKRGLEEAKRECRDEQARSKARMTRCGGEEWAHEHGAAKGADYCAKAIERLLEER